MYKIMKKQKKWEIKNELLKFDYFYSGAGEGT